jgi:hypothetical protein
MRIMQRAIFVPCCRVNFSSQAQAIDLSSDMMRNIEIYLASWRHSADTGANAYRSKVIGGRFYDACFDYCSVFVEMWHSHEQRVTASSVILAGISTGSSEAANS